MIVLPEPVGASTQVRVAPCVRRHASSSRASSWCSRRTTSGQAAAGSASARDRASPGGGGAVCSVVGCNPSGISFRPLAQASALGGRGATVVARRSCGCRRGDRSPVTPAARGSATARQPYHRARRARMLRNPAGGGVTTGAPGSIAVGPRDSVRPRPVTTDPDTASHRPSGARAWVRPAALVISCLVIGFVGGLGAARRRRAGDGPRARARGVRARRPPARPGGTTDGTGDHRAAGHDHGGGPAGGAARRATRSSSRC